MERLVFILGCTAVGKGTVARHVAGKIGGSIVSVDSMKVYRRMDIGTAKPTPLQRRGLPHYCIDLVEPCEAFSVARYVEHADAAVADIRAGGSVPLAVGGTSLYVKALSEGLFEAPSPDEATRRRLRDRAAVEGAPALHAELKLIDPAAAGRIHPNDAKRILRGLEVHAATGRPISELQSQWDAGGRRYHCTFVGLRRTKEDLHRRINVRVAHMVEAGLVDEVRSLLDEPAGLAPQAAQAVGYAEIIDHLAGHCSQAKAVERIKINTRRLAKKQATWHRRWNDVKWFDLPADEPPERSAERIMAEVSFK